MAGWRPHWRKMTWFIVIVNALFLVWIITGVASVADECKGLSGDELEICEAGTAIGAGIGVTVILVLWVIVDLILGVLWLVTRSTGRTCPACGSNVKKGATVCSKCGHDFARAAQGPAPA